jgi:THO complex subunit 5
MTALVLDAFLQPDRDSDMPQSLPPSPDDVVQKLRDLVSPTYLEYEATNVNIRATALMARLKALNRAANAATRARKQATTDARQEMDQTHLGLQNLLYEKRHLEREIEKCRQFASALLGFRLPSQH